MGCLRLTVKHIACGIHHTVKECSSTLIVKFLRIGATPKLSIRNMNSGVKVNVSLVCSVGLGKWEVFNVSEGPLILEEGVLKVLKDR